MHLKRYSFFAFLLIAVVGALVYTQVDSRYTIEVFGVPVDLPIAVWIILPMILLYLASYFHMAYYSFRRYLKDRNFKKDYEVLVDSIFRAIFKEPKKRYYKTQEFKNIGSVIDRSNIILNEFKFDCKEDKLRIAIEYIKDIQRGDFVEIKDIKLSSNNPINLKNLENRMAKEPTYSGVILNKCDEFNSEICKKALKIYITYAPIEKIKEHTKLFDEDILFELIENRSKREDLNLNVNDIVDILQKSKIKIDYIALAKEVKKIFMPDSRLKLFELLKEKDEKAEDGYIFTLLDLEMLEKAKDVLENIQEDEFLSFKAFLELKECGRDYPLELFV